ncbi:MAG TPA: DUF1223 domain-containing protein [Acidobacteriaceae bacterium]|nr:DUF1223 domain-containing protein [Acidobacteriaceae bacterium]
MLRSSRALLLGVLAAALTAASAQKPRSPVLVELFTSEGCSSCPPADALLSRFDHEQPIPNADIIALGEHVDYWDHLGWRDRFSSSDFTRRQRSYQSTFHLDDIYTPQVVVNGSSQFNGTDSAAISRAIEQAAARTVPLQFIAVHLEPGNRITFTLANGPVDHSEYIRIFGALVDPSATTQISAGENGGRTLHHVAVVRTLDMLGESWHMKDLGMHPFSLSLKSPANLTGMRLVVFAQTKPFGPILATVSCVLSTTSATHLPATAHFPENSCPTISASTIEKQ